jgi:hypothetical protein
MFPQLEILGPAEAEQICQKAIQLSATAPCKPARRNQKLSDLGVTDAAIILLIDSLVHAVKARNCTLDPGTLNGITIGTLYGAMVDLVEQASRP